MLLVFRYTVEKMAKSKENLFEEARKVLHCLVEATQRLDNTAKEMDTGTVKVFSAAECEKIVKNALKTDADNLRLISYNVVRGSNELVGFMGEYYKLHVRVADECSDSGVRELCYFVKTVPISNALHKDECERKGFFGKETRIYTQILPNIQKYATVKLYPCCYYTRHDLLVLEDLAADFRHLRADEPYTAHHHKLFLTHLAQLHAASIAWEVYEHVNIGELLKDALFELMLTKRNEWYMAGAKGIMFLAKRYGKFQTPQLQALINERLYPILMNVERFTEPSKKMRNVFCHRDSWDRNIFYKFNAQQQLPTDCCIVDFQLSRYSPPALDLLFFLYGTTTAEQRKHNMSDYLKHYYSSLQASLRRLKLPENTIPIAEFEENCRRARLPVLIIWSICKPLTMMPEGLSNKMRAEEQEKFDHYMNKERDEFFLRVMALDPTYESKIMWPIEELIEYLLEHEDIYE